MIQFTCSMCGKRFAVRAGLAGRDGVCACGAMIRVPHDSPIPVARETGTGHQLVGPSHPGSTLGIVPKTDDGSWTRSEKLLLWGGLGGVVFVVFPVILYVFIWRGQWASEHRQAVLELNIQAESFVRQKGYEEAKGKYDELFGKVNERDLADAEFKQKVEAARLASTENNKKVEAILAARAEAEQQKKGDAQNKAIEAARPKERYYRDSHGAIISETDAENSLSRIRSNIDSMPDNAGRAFYEGELRAVEEEWARIKQQGPIDQ
jgi:hypothetical protein